jgi:hypothetical protein
MFIKGIELTGEDWDNLLPQIDELLRQSPEFTSPTYSLQGLKSVNDLWILVKPTQPEFIELLKPLNLNWQDVEILINDEL